MTPRENSVKQLSEIYNVVTGAALAFAITNVIDTNAEFIPIKSAPGLCFLAFFVTLIPFHQGAVRHLFATYVEDGGSTRIARGALALDFVILFVEACLGGALVVVLLLASQAVARDLDGRYAASPLKPWFDSLKSGKGPCCSDADGWALSDVDWETKGGRYRVRVPVQSWTPSKAQPAPPAAIEMTWVDVEADAVITEPNRAGRTMVWPLWGIGGVTIRCFMPGSMT